ncbi:MAG: hypothetical protein ACE5HO_00330 [bacterium]
MVARISLPLLMLLLLDIPLGHTQEGRLRYRADVFKRERVGRQVLQIFEGHVRFEQNQTKISCDKAVQYVGLGKTILSGTVEINDKNRTLFADTVYFYDRVKMEVAVGKVRVVADADTTTGNRMTYYEAQDSLVSEGDVEVISPKEQTRLTGGYLSYNRASGAGMVLKNPVLIQYDSLNTEMMRIVSDTLETFEGGSHVRAIHNVDIKQAGIEATCGKADYFKPHGLVVLRDHPRAWQRNQQISGDTLEIYLKESKLQRARALGHAITTSDADTLNKGRWVNKLTGQRIDLYFVDEKLEKVIVADQATSVYHIIEDDQYKGANEVSGDQITLFLSAKGAVSRIHVESSPGSSNGKYKPPSI